MDRAVAAYWQLRELREAYPDRFLWQTYSDVLADLPSAVREAATFLAPDVSEAVVDDIAAELSLESAKARQELERAHIQTKLRALRQRDPRLAARFVHALRRGRGGSLLAIQDGDTLMHYNHISPYGGAVGAWRTRLNEPIRVEIERRYGDWYDDAFGADWANAPIADASPEDGT